MFGGFYTVRFQLGDAIGRSVMYVGGGKLLGGKSAFAHIGTYEAEGQEIVIEVSTVRHNPDPNYKAMAGTDDATCLRAAKLTAVSIASRAACGNCPTSPFAR